MSIPKIPSVIGMGIDAVLGCLRHNLVHAKIQEMGCWALVNMALRSSHKQALLHGGVIQVIVNAMDAHPSNKKVQYRALFALITLVNMGVRHKTLALEGVQFHPESVLTPEGDKLMANFMRMTAS